ncbi:hypothetical protein ACIQZN_08880 [Streptomyces sp. NPDC097595]|uniref:hypothetical protein n=1 Tax=Streptomyces sp. NPDC097595 TaxID=3366090 RepID=UPI00380072F9
MNEFMFELEQFSAKEEEGRSGTAGAFGTVTVSVPRRKFRDKSLGNSTEIRADGEHIPEVVYRAVGRPRPGLRDGRLLVDGTPVDLSFNRNALRNKSRALQLTHQGRAYAYIVTGNRKGAVLRRAGADITIAREKSTSGRGLNSVGTATGDVDAVDLALAVVFEEVDTFDLTSFGAATTAFNRIVTPRTHDSGVGSE